MLDGHMVYGNLGISKGLRTYTLQITKRQHGRKKLLLRMPSPLKMINSLLKQDRLVCIPYACLNGKHLATLLNG